MMPENVKTLQMFLTQVSCQTQIYKSCWDCQVSPTPCFLFLSKGCWTPFKLLFALLGAWRIPTVQDRTWSLLYRHLSVGLSFARRGCVARRAAQRHRNLFHRQLQAPSKGEHPAHCSIIHFSACYILQTLCEVRIFQSCQPPEVQDPDKQTPFPHWSVTLNFISP